MVFSLTASPGVCQNLTETCFNLCNSSSVICHKYEYNVSLGAQILTIGLIYIGTILVIKGTAHGIVVIKILSDKCCNKNLVIEDYQSLQSQRGFWDSLYHPKHWYNTTLNVVNHSWKAFANLTVSSLPFFTSYIISKIPTEFCYNPDNCPEYAKQCVSVCNWTQEYFVEVIQKFLNGD